MKRSMYAGRVREEHIGQEITLKGWVSRRRDLGGLIFIDLRDREGIMQLVINPEKVSAEVMATAESLRSEFVIEVTGQVAAREQANDKLPTGAVELNVTALTVLNTAKTTPFEIKDGIEANDDTRLRYRYLDLRRPEMLENLKLRAKVTHSILTTWMSWSLSMWRHHSFLSQRQKGRVTIWCHLVSIKGISTLFLKVHRLPSNF